MFMHDLVDVSPDMFVNTKADEGPCELIHSDDLKESFENSGDTTIFDDEIDRCFTSKISDIDRVIKVSN